MGLADDVVTPGRRSSGPCVSPRSVAGIGDETWCAFRRTRRAGVICDPNELTGNRTPIDFAPARDWDRSGRRFGAPEKARRELNFLAKTPMREGLEHAIEWAHANHDAIRRCMLQHAAYMPGLHNAVEWPACAS